MDQTISNFYKSTPTKTFLIQDGDQKTILSKREIECLMYLLQGRIAKETAAILEISTKSVESYIASAKLKLKVHSKSDLIAKAKEINLTDPGYLDWLIRSK